MNAGRLAYLGATLLLVALVSVVLGNLTAQALFARLGAQVPDFLIAWLPRWLGADGEAAYDAAELALALECALTGLGAYLLGGRLRRQASAR